jgi:hypothetical protein
MENAKMKSLNTKLVLSALGIVAMLTSTAFAQKRHHVSYVNQSAVSTAIPGYDAVSTAIPGYDKVGGVVGIVNPDQR